MAISRTANVTAAFTSTNIITVAALGGSPAVGDLWLLALGWTGPVTITGVPAGWLLERAAIQSAGGAHVSIYSRIIAAADIGAAKNWTFSASINSVIGMAGYRGTMPNPAASDVNAVNTFSGITTNMNAGPLVMPGDREAWFDAFAWNQANTGNTEATGFNFLNEVAHPTAALSLMIGDKLNLSRGSNSSAGATNTSSGTVSSAGVSLGLREFYLIDTQLVMDTPLNTLLRR